MKQLDIFSQMHQHYKITKPIRLIELFAGIGSQAKALQNLNANFEHYRVVEYDKYPVISYNAIHGTNFATSDITKISGADLGIVDTDKYEYIMTYSFPCQDLSLAGNQKGMKKGSGTRSGLLWEVERLLQETCGYKEHRVKPNKTTIHSIANWVDDYNFDIDKTKLPQVLLMENVPDVIGTNNIKDFNAWQYFLESLGYSNYVEILNAKDYTIPQNRRRAFMVSVLGNYSYEFPPKVKLQKRLKDLLESEVDEKYYLSDKQIENIKKSNYGVTKNRIYKPNKVVGTLCARDYKDPKCVEIIPYGTYFTWKDKQGNINTQCNRAANPNKSALTVATTEPGKVVIPEDTVKAIQMQPKDRDYNKKNIKRESQFELRKDNIANSILTNDIKNMIAIKNVNNQEGVFNTLGTNCGSSTSSGGGVVVIPEDTKQGYALAENVNLRIRKLTARECFRLMGFTDTDFDKASKVNSNAQLYKQAGNSIVVQVLEAIFKQLF